MGKLIHSIYTGHWPESEQGKNHQLAIKGSGECCNVAERNDTSEQFWADDEKDTEEIVVKAKHNKPKQKRSKESCLLCDSPLNGKPCICASCKQRLREWMPGGVEELAIRGRWADHRSVESTLGCKADSDSLFFCPVGAENRLLFGRFSNLPRFAKFRPSSSSSDSDVDFKADRQKRMRKRLKERKQKADDKKCDITPYHSTRECETLSQNRRASATCSNGSNGTCSICNKNSLHSSYSTKKQ